MRKKDINVGDVVMFRIPGLSGTADVEKKNLFSCYCSGTIDRRIGKRVLKIPYRNIIKKVA
jgi:hypothetical protein